MEEIRYSLAPWTEDEVASLNGYQAEGKMHPFTCGSLHVDSSPVLVATEECWVCPEDDCEYTQGWAHPWMADFSWKGF